MMQSMRDMMRSTLGRSLRPLAPLDRLAAAWPVACGPALAERGELVSLDDGTLTVVVASAAWLDPFGQMRGVLASDLSRIAAVPVCAIHFVLKA